MISRSRPDSETALAQASASDQVQPAGLGRVAVLVDQVAEREAAALQAGADPSAPPQSTARIITALRSLGYEPVELALVAERRADWLGQLMNNDFRFAFNLCETIGGQAHGEHLAAAAVQLLDLPMTGASAETLLLCLNKDRCAAILRAHGVEVPDWCLLRRDPARSRRRSPRLAASQAEPAFPGRLGSLSGDLEAGGRGRFERGAPLFRRPVAGRAG